MLAGKRPFKSNAILRSMMSRLPEWMKMSIDEESVGARFLNCIAAEEMGLLGRNLNLYSKYININDCPVDHITKMYELELEYPFSSGNIEPQDRHGNILNYRIYPVEDELTFLTNPPTRLAEDGADTIRPSGLNGTILGVEWMHAEPTGMLAVQDSQSPVEASSTLYCYTKTVDNSVNEIPFSGDALGKSYVGLTKNASYDLLMFDMSHSLETLYPTGIWISSSGDSITAPTAAVYGYSSFIDPSGNKTYYDRALNNPYGSGVYNLSDRELTFDPISGTVKVYDILNLTPSGTPYEIPSSGAIVYTFTSGNWSYRGYYQTVPWEWTPPDIQANIIQAQGSGLTITATSGTYVSWQMLPSGGYLDTEVYPYSGTFTWIDGTGGTDKTIRFTNAESRYQAEYEYILHGNIRQLSSAPRDDHGSVGSRVGTLYFINGSQEYQEVSVEQSESSNLAVRIDPEDVRPGTSLKVILKVNAKRTEQWLNAQTNDKTVQFYQHNIGAFDQFGGY